MSVGPYLNRVLEVWRPTTTPDGAGGQQVTFVRQPDDVAAKVDQPSATERLLAQQAESRHSHNVYVLPAADVRRGDELRGSDEVYRVLAVVEPSSPAYRKAESELIQSEGDPDG